MSWAEIKTAISSVKLSLAVQETGSKESEVLSVSDHAVIISDIDAAIAKLTDTRRIAEEQKALTKEEQDRVTEETVCGQKDCTEKITRDGNLIDYVDYTSEGMKKMVRKRYVYNTTAKGKRYSHYTIEFFDL